MWIWRVLDPTTGTIRPGKVGYLLLLVVLVQFSYPVTEGNSTLGLIAYQLLISSLVVAGILVAGHSPRIALLLIVLGVVWVITAVIYTLNQSVIEVLLITYVVLMLFQGTVVWVLLQFIFQARHITRDVLYAASAVYLLLGAVFVPLYGILETLTFTLGDGTHAFTDGILSAEEVFPWQDFVYYSYATLTTLGYGDILPITMWARSIASLEAVIGVLYITIIMARLVGLYATQEIEEAVEEAIEDVMEDERNRNDRNQA